MLINKLLSDGFSTSTTEITSSINFPSVQLYCQNLFCIQNRYAIYLFKKKKRLECHSPKKISTTDDLIVIKCYW